MNIKRERIFLYFFIFLTFCLQNVSAQDATDKNNRETPKSTSNAGENRCEKSSEFALWKTVDKDSNAPTMIFSKTDFTSDINNFRYDFLDDAVKKNRQFITKEEQEVLNRSSVFLP